MSVLIKGMEMPIACSRCCLTGTCRWWLEVESMFDRHRDCPLVEAPSAEPKRGKWIKISPANIYECSVCHQNVKTEDIEEYHFCHHCGAYMEANR